ncbi:ATP-grasp domain-containing protein [Sideroxyarcus sp. TK5]
MNATTEQNTSETTFLGLAPFLRASVSGQDLKPYAEALLAEAQQKQTDGQLWMNLSVAMQCIGQRDIGLSIQAIALEQQRIYRLPAMQQPVLTRLLVLMAPGDIAANTPIDCLLERTDVDLILYYVSQPDPLALPIPEHDAVLVAISESDANRATLLALEEKLHDWPQPVINQPKHIPCVGRDAASELLRDAAGIEMPPTLRCGREVLQAIAAGQTTLAANFPGNDYPIIVRPYDSQAGRDLARIASAQELAAYLAKVQASDLFIARFVDYSGDDGLFRKFRIALIAGQPYACHMAVSGNWMIHYLNAGMYEDANKRAEELAFMEHFDDFAQRHRNALDEIYRRTGLDYLLIDGAETRDGKLLIFEIDHTMVVHAMDPEELFPYKQQHIAKARDAFRAYLQRLTASRHG